MPFQSNAKPIVAYVEESRIFKNTLVSQWNGNPTLSKDRLTWMKVGILYKKPKLLTAANHNTILNYGFDCGGCFLNTHEARIVKYVIDEIN